MKIEKILKSKILNFYNKTVPKKDLNEVRFELTPPERCGPEPHALDH